MTIGLWDLDVPYELMVDCTDEGKDFVRIKPNTVQDDRVEDTYDICLPYEKCQELIRALKFISEEIKPKTK